MTAAERTLLTKLRGDRLKGYRFHRQTSIENYIVDFYCPEKHLILEIDGAVRYLYGKPQSDQRRQEYLEGLGFRVLRFTNEDVKNMIEMAFDRILFAIENTK
jgi:very-short-patch-repair endonuclease